MHSLPDHFQPTGEGLLALSPYLRAAPGLRRDQPPTLLTGCSPPPGGPEIRRLDDAVRSESALRRHCSGLKNIFRDNEACTFGRSHAGNFCDVAALAVTTPTTARRRSPASSAGRDVGAANHRRWRSGAAWPLRARFTFCHPRELRLAARGDLHFVQDDPRLQVAVRAHNWSV